MNVAERVAEVWKKYLPHKEPDKLTITIDGDPVLDSRPKLGERAVILSDTRSFEARKSALYACVARAYRDGWVEGQGYVAHPDLVTRRVLEGLQHIVSHVHHHCKHGSDGLEGFGQNGHDEDEDTLPTGKSSPISAGSRLSRTAWRRCRKDPCSALVQLISDCRLWDALSSPIDARE